MGPRPRNRHPRRRLDDVDGRAAGVDDGGSDFMGVRAWRPPTVGYRDGEYSRAVVGQRVVVCRGSSGHRGGADLAARCAGRNAALGAHGAARHAAGLAPPLLLMGAPGVAFAWGLSGIPGMRRLAPVWRSVGALARTFSTPMRAAVV